MIILFMYLLLLISPDAMNKDDTYDDIFDDDVIRHILENDEFATLNINPNYPRTNYNDTDDDDIDEEVLRLNNHFATNNNTYTADADAMDYLRNYHLRHDDTDDDTYYDPDYTNDDIMDNYSYNETINDEFSDNNDADPDAMWTNIRNFLLVEHLLSDPNMLRNITQILGQIRIIVRIII